MTLIDDSLDMVKASLLVAIKNELTETYPVEFGDYTTNKGDVCSKVYWSDTTRFQPRYPYCRLTPHRDISEGYEETVQVKNANGVTVKRNITRSFLTVTIDVTDMGNENIGKSSLQADTFAHKVARQLRKFFNGEGKLDWFSGNEYYPRQIGIVVDTDISAILNWSDTDTEFRYSFDIQMGWDDFIDSEADLAKGIETRIYENTNNIGTIITKIGKE